MQAKTLQKKLNKFRSSDITYDLTDKFSVSEGMKFLAEHDHAWLLKLYTIVLHDLKTPEVGFRTFLKMFKDENIAHVKVTDENLEQIASYQIKLEDVPVLDSVRLQAVWNGERWVILLSSER